MQKLKNNYYFFLLFIYIVIHILFTSCNILNFPIFFCTLSEAKRECGVHTGKMSLLHIKFLFFCNSSSFYSFSFLSFFQTILPFFISLLSLAFPLFFPPKPSIFASLGFSFFEFFTTIASTKFFAYFSKYY